jgi:hypothetical protein
MNPGPLPNIALSNSFHPITDKVRQVDWHSGFTAASNCAIYTARAYPPEYWNRTAFVSDPTGHLTAAFVLQQNGTGYVARYGWNLVAADDEWAAPIDAQVGPDGNVWVLDWYNFIVQHNPTPAGFKTGKGGAYESDLRDRTHGRVYRLVYTQALRRSARPGRGEGERAGRGPQQRQPVLAAARPAAAGGSRRQIGRGSAAEAGRRRERQPPGGAARRLGARRTEGGRDVPGRAGPPVAGRPPGCLANAAEGRQIR